MDIVQECLAYFKNIDIDFDLLIIADTQNKTTKNSNYFRIYIRRYNIWNYLWYFEKTKYVKSK